MIKRNKDLIKFEKEFLKSNDLSLNQKYKILHYMYIQAANLGKFKIRYKIKDLRNDLKIAKVINNV